MCNWTRYRIKKLGEEDSGLVEHFIHTATNFRSQQFLIWSLQVEASSQIQASIYFIPFYCAIPMFPKNNFEKVKSSKIIFKIQPLPTHNPQTIPSKTSADRPHLFVKRKENSQFTFHFQSRTLTRANILLFLILSFFPHKFSSQEKRFQFVIFFLYHKTEEKDPFRFCKVFLLCFLSCQLQFNSKKILICKLKFIVVFFSVCQIN